MPALHDFAIFVTYAHRASTFVAQQLTIDSRSECKSVLDKVFQNAKAKLGTGITPRQMVYVAASVDVLPQVSQQVGLMIQSAVEAWTNYERTLENTGYGVLDLYSSQNALQKALICACIDDLVRDTIWRDALRSAIMGTSSSSSVETSDVLARLSLIVIASACEPGSMLHALSLWDFTGSTNINGPDMLSMYGIYVLSRSVSARDVLVEASNAPSTNESKRSAALQALMWNLTALDLNSSPSDVDWPSRVSNNATRAGIPGKLIFQSILLESVPAAEREFTSTLSVARKDASRFIRRRGETYVTGLFARQIAAWVYIGGIISVAILFAVYNWANRDNIYDRAKDAFDIATVCLISVFGLIKLTSEDANALKNLAVGRSFVDDLEDAESLLHGSANDVRKLISVDQSSGSWASAEGCSYGRGVEGDGLDAGAANVAVLKQAGFFFLECICKRPYDWDTCAVVQNVSLDETVILAYDSMGKSVDFSRSPTFRSLC